MSVFCVCYVYYLFCCGFDAADSLSHAYTQWLNRGWHWFDTVAYTRTDSMGDNKTDEGWSLISTIAVLCMWRSGQFRSDCGCRVWTCSEVSWSRCLALEVLSDGSRASLLAVIHSVQACRCHRCWSFVEWFGQLHMWQCTHGVYSHGVCLFVLLCWPLLCILRVTHQGAVPGNAHG